MKIAYVTPVYPPYGGGMGRVVQETVENLSDHEITVFVPDYEGREVKDNKVKGLTPHFPFKSIISKFVSIDNAAFLPQIKQELSNFDLVHLHYPFFGTDRIVADWKQENKNTPLVVTYHMDTETSGLKGVIFDLYREVYLDTVLSVADKLIGSTFDYISHSFAKQHFKQQRDKWIELPFGVDIEKFKPETPESDLLEKHNLDVDKKTVLFVGGMDPAHEFKGIPVLLEAINKLTEKGKEFQVVLVGSGELQEKYKQLALDKKINNHINFVGFVEDDRLSQLYTLADVTVLPSISRNEAFGLVLLESYACDTPVIASDLPGVRELASKAGTVFSVDNTKELASNIEKLLEETNNSETNSRKIAEKYSWKHRTEKLKKLYKKLKVD